MQNYTNQGWRNAVCGIFFLDYKTAKITAVEQACDSNWFVSPLCIETKVRVSLRERFFLAFRHVEFENVKKAKIK